MMTPHLSVHDVREIKIDAPSIDGESAWTDIDLIGNDERVTLTVFHSGHDLKITAPENLYEQFGRAVAAILEGKSELGSDELGDISAAAERIGLTLTRDVVRCWITIDTETRRIYGAGRTPHEARASAGDYTSMLECETVEADVYATSIEEIDQTTAYTEV